MVKPLQNVSFKTNPILKSGVKLSKKMIAVITVYLLFYGYRKDLKLNTYRSDTRFQKNVPKNYLT